MALLDRQMHAPRGEFVRIGCERLVRVPSPNLRIDAQHQEPGDVIDAVTDRRELPVKEVRV